MGRGRRQIQPTAKDVDNNFKRRTSLLWLMVSEVVIHVWLALLVWACNITIYITRRIDFQSPIYLIASQEARRKKELFRGICLI